MYKKAAAPIIANPPKVNITVPTPPVTGNVNLLFFTHKLVGGGAGAQVHRGGVAVAAVFQ